MAQVKLSLLLSGEPTALFAVEALLFSAFHRFTKDVHVTFKNRLHGLYCLDPGCLPERVPAQLPSKPLDAKPDASEQIKPGCSSPDCPLVNIDTVHFPDEPQLDTIVEQRSRLQMTRTTPGAAVPPTLAAYRIARARVARPQQHVLAGQGT